MIREWIVRHAQYRFHLSGFILDLLLNAGGDVFSFSWVAWALAVGGVLGMLAVLLEQILWTNQKWQ